MSLTRKLLKGMGLTDEQVDTIIEAHIETVDGLKDEIDKHKDASKKLTDLEKQLADAKSELDTAKKDGWKDKHDAIKKEFDKYKSEQTAKETKAAKEKAVKAYYEKANITGNDLSVAMRGSRDEIEAVELDDNGNIKDTSAFDALVKGDFAKLVSTTTKKGADTSNPPANGGGGTYSSKADIMKIADRAERRKAIAENPQLFSKGDE